MCEYKVYIPWKNIFKYFFNFYSQTTISDATPEYRVHERQQKRM